MFYEISDFTKAMRVVGMINELCERMKAGPPVPFRDFTPDCGNRIVVAEPEFRKGDGGGLPGCYVALDIIDDAGEWDIVSVFGDDIPGCKVRYVDDDEHGTGVIITFLNEMGGDGGHFQIDIDSQGRWKCLN